MLKRIFASLFTIILFTIIGSSVRSLHADAAWYVAPNGNDLNDCATPATACQTLGGTVEKLTAGATVYVASGIYTARYTTETVVLNLDKNIQLSGGWDTTFTQLTGLSMIDGQHARGGLTIAAGAAVVLDRFVIQNCSGGGVAMWQSSLTLKRSALRNNTAYMTGGGIYAYDSTVIINDSSLTGNRVNFGDGGGIRQAFGSLALNNVTITDNQASAGGGGLSLTSVSASIRSSTFNNNTVFLGKGGGLWILASNVSVKNSILTGNFTYDYNQTGNQTPNCYVEGNPIASAGYNVIGDLTGCLLTTTATDQINVDPELGPMAGLPIYRPLLAGSPAINSGDPVGCTDQLGDLLLTDQRGLPRVGRCDIGAYEASLSFTKEVAGPMRPGATITYTLRLRNLEGLTTLGVITVTDHLPVSMTHVPGSLIVTQGSGQLVSDTLQWTGPVSANAETRLSFQMVINDHLSPTVVIPNVATADWAGVTITAAAYVDLRSQTLLPLITNRYRTCANDLPDDFSNPGTGWPIDDDGDARYEYLNGEYRILARQTGYLYLATAPTCPRQNYIVETDARWSGATGNSYGLIFGVAADFSAYYLFDVNTDLGLYRLYRRDPTGFAIVVPPTGSAAIHGGTAVNRLKVLRNSGWISLYINGTLVNNLLPDVSPAPPASNAGLIASPYSGTPNADARFDNFLFVSLPDSAANNGRTMNYAADPASSHHDSVLETSDTWRTPIERYPH